MVPERRRRCEDWPAMERSVMPLWSPRSQLPAGGSPHKADIESDEIDRRTRHGSPTSSPPIVISTCSARKAFSRRPKEGSSCFAIAMAPSSLAYQGITCARICRSSLKRGVSRPWPHVLFRVDPEIANARGIKLAKPNWRFMKTAHPKAGRSAAYEEVLTVARANGWKIAIIDAEKPIG